ncbi:hypothetical protein QVD17_24261 [Tagetes erecta]|uniref:Uncharacterized protein n=1 Tax=Tagetes erecta TaxID=13708 RepID=A0AAD8KEW2_TARER|nr:hypothetical protein QVD17_24261 [Tagetes erecta]
MKPTIKFIFLHHKPPTTTTPQLSDLTPTIVSSSSSSSPSSPSPSLSPSLPPKPPPPPPPVHAVVKGLLLCPLISTNVKGGGAPGLNPLFTSLSSSSTNCIFSGALTFDPQFLSLNLETEEQRNVIGLQMGIVNLGFGYNLGSGVTPHCDNTQVIRDGEVELGGWGGSNGSGGSWRLEMVERCGRF